MESFVAERLLIGTIRPPGAHKDLGNRARKSLGAELGPLGPNDVAVVLQPMALDARKGGFYHNEL